MSIGEHGKAVNAAAGDQLAFRMPLGRGVNPRYQEWTLPRNNPPKELPRGPGTRPSREPLPPGKPRPDAPVMDDDYAPPDWGDDGEFKEPREWQDDEDRPSEYRRRRKRRRRACCDPALFPEWAVELTRTQETADSLSAAHLPWDKRKAAQKGYSYQFCIYGTTSEFQCSGGGSQVKADASFPARCWIGDAKYINDTGKSVYVPRTGRVAAIIQSNVKDEYERYGEVTKYPDYPAKESWNIGLQTAVSKPGLPIIFFKSLYVLNDIEGQVLYQSMPEKCRASPYDTSPQYKHDDDWWNYDPSEYQHQEWDYTRPPIA